MTAIDVDLDELADVFRSGTGEALSDLIASSLDNIADAIRLHAAAMLVTALPHPDSGALSDDAEYLGTALFSMLQQFHRRSIKEESRGL